MPGPVSQGASNSGGVLRSASLLQEAPPPKVLRSPMYEVRGGVIDGMPVLSWHADGASLALPLRPDKLLHLTCDRYPELKQFERELSPGNVERALSELHALMPRAVRLDRSELVGLDVAVLTEFKRQLVRGMGAKADAADSRAPPVPASSSTRKRAASQAQDDELMEVMSLVDKKSIKQQEKQKGADELLELINKPSAKQARS